MALGDMLQKLRRLFTIPKKYKTCTEAAEQKGITLVGLDDRRCWTGDDAASSYDMYGHATCTSNKKGNIQLGNLESGTMAVYQKDNNGKLLLITAVPLSEVFKDAFHSTKI